MRPTPIPSSWTGQRMVIGDPERGHHPCEYAVMPSESFPGRSRFMARIELQDGDRRLLANGCVLWMEMDGGELPWALHVASPDYGVPD